MNGIILLFLIILIPLMAQIYVKFTYKKYSRIKCINNISGYDNARRILDKNKLNEIYIVKTSGNLTDHYDSKRKTIRLSKEVYENDTIASIAVSAHECGHALQDKEGYFFFKIRAALFPIINFTSSISYIVIFIGFAFELVSLAYIGFGFILLGIIFQALNLPLEFNASKRAEKELKNLNTLNNKELKGIRKMLKAAALTYIAGMLASILELLRLILIFSDND